MCMRSSGMVMTMRLALSGFTPCSSISACVASSTDWIGEPTHHFLIEASMTSKRWPSSSMRMSGLALSAKPSKKLPWPVNGSSTPVMPEATIIAPATPLRAPMPPKSNAFSTWSLSRYQ